MTHGQPCNISEEFLEAYILARFETEETVAFEDHLLLCPTCQDRVVAMGEHVLALKAALSEIHTGPGATEGEDTKPSQKCPIGA